MAAPSKDQSFSSLPVAAKVFILVLLLGLVSAIYYFALHMSLADEIDSARAQHVQLQGEYQEAERRQREYLELVQVVANREAIDRQNKRVLPERAEIAAFLQDLNRLAELSGLRIRLVEPRPEEPEELYVRIPVSLGLSGKHHQIAKFLYNVSRLERAINMEDINLTDPRLEGEDVVLKVDLKATTFRRPTEAESQAAPAQPGQPAPAAGGAG